MSMTQEVTPQPSEREKILAEAVQTICHDRQNQYGSPEDNFNTISNFWTDYILAKQEAEQGSPFLLTGEDVANMMVLFKVARTVTGTYKRDNYIDMAGYAACGGEIGWFSDHPAKMKKL